MQRDSSIKQCVGSYVLEFQTEPSRFRKGMRYHWMIYRAHKPDELVSWGHAPTQHLAELDARNEVKDLDSGLTQGGRVTSTNKVALHHC
jgi:hypothetical protein